MKVVAANIVIECRRLTGKNEKLKKIQPHPLPLPNQNLVEIAKYAHTFKTTTQKKSTQVHNLIPYAIVFTSIWSN